MLVVIGCPVKDRAWCLPYWFEAIDKQNETLHDVQGKIICILSASTDGTEEIMEHQGVEIIRDERPGRSINDIDGHCWGQPNTYAYMADMRNKLVRTAIELKADYFFSLDSDIILPDSGLATMLKYAVDHHGVIAPAVNMAVGETSWNQMDWIDPYRPGLAIRNPRWPETGRSDVVMGAMLLDRAGMEVTWQSHSQGEDVGFCLDAEAKQIPRWWLPEVKCDHLMRR
jgi:hypothetical protein